MENKMNISDSAIEDIVQELKSDAVLAHPGYNASAIKEIQSISDETLFTDLLLCGR